MPEQEFLPPRRRGGFPGPDVPQDEDPLPWAGLPSVVPSTGPSRPAPDYPMGSWQSAGPPPPRPHEQVPGWAGPDPAAGADRTAPSSEFVPPRDSGPPAAASWAAGRARPHAGDAAGWS